MELGVRNTVDIESWRVDIHVILPALWLGLQQNGDDHTVDGNGLAENNRNQVHGSDSGRLDRRGEDGASTSQNSATWV